MLVPASKALEHLCRDTYMGILTQITLGISNAATLLHVV